VIDSDPASLYLTKKYLSEAGYSVAATDDPGRGVEIARLARPAIVCVDLDLLEGGLDSLEQVARAVDGLVIAISTDPAAEARAKEAGARSFLSKPVERAELLRTLEQAPTREPGRILVVDDDADTLDLICAMLEGAGYQIVTAANGREALDQIALARPEALILDLMLPEMDGFEVVYRLGLNAEWRHIPVILLTARDLSHEERRALDIGTARILQKGNYSRDELLAELKCITGAAQPALSTPG
jgi:CheY-like chemotaxis protein